MLGRIIYWIFKQSVSLLGLHKRDKLKQNPISWVKEDEDDIKQVVKTTKEELMYYLSPVYSKDQIKDLDEDQLMELLDEVIDRVYKVNMKRGGIIKDPSFNIYNSGGPVKPTQFMELQNILNAMSEEERKNLQFMLNQLLENKK